MATTTCNSLDLIIGFTAGQIQLIDPLSRERQKCFNDEVTSFQPAFNCSKLTMKTPEQLLKSVQK